MEKIIDDLLSCFEVDTNDLTVLKEMTKILYNANSTYCDNILSLIAGYDASDVVEEIEDEINVKNLYKQFNITKEDDSFVPLCKYISLLSFDEGFDEFNDVLDEVFSLKNVKLDISNLRSIFEHPQETILKELSKLLNDNGYNLVTFSPIDDEVLQFSIIKSENKEKFDKSFKSLFKKCDIVLEDYKLF